jgi:hypothetical protein
MHNRPTEGETVKRHVKGSFVVAEVLFRMGGGRWFVYDTDGDGYPVEWTPQGWREAPPLKWKERVNL